MSHHWKVRLYQSVVSLTLVSCLSLSGCGSSTSSSEEGGDATDTSSNNALSTAFPDDLAIASLTASGSSSSALRAALTLKNAQVTNETPLEKKEDLADLVNFSDEAAFTEKLGGMKDDINIFASAPNANCYGPTLNYSNHSDAATGTPSSGQLPSGDLGIWTETETATGEACVAAKMNNIMGQFENLVNAGTKTVAATLGAASLDEALDALPAAGASQDLKAKANEVMTENSVPLSFDTATLERETTDTADGDPVFVTTTEGSMDLTDGSADFSTILTHVPMGEEPASLKTKHETTDASTIKDDLYCGRLVQGMDIASSEVPTLGNCNGSDGVTRCILVDYCKESSTSLTYHLRTAEFCGQNVDCGTVDPANKKTGSNAHGWGNNFYYTVCTVNPEDSSGSCAQAWQAGAGDGNTRVLNVKVAADGSGCGYFGYGPDVAATSGVGAIDRMICNWAGPGNNHTGVAKAQRQCFTKNSEGKFISNSSNLAITYAPTNDCNKSAAKTTFSYDGVAAGVAVTNNLISLTDVDFTVPTLPNVPVD